MPKCKECPAYGIDNLKFSGCLIKNTIKTLKGGDDGCHMHKSTIENNIAKVKETEPRAKHYIFLNNPIDIKYRCESFRGSGVRDIIDVIMFEVLELNNVDILLYLKDKYFYNSLYARSIDLLIKKLFSTSNREDNLKEDCHIIIKSLIDELKIVTGKDIKYCLWLADLDAVKEIYGTEDICYYFASNIVLSDLGKDGKLYAYEEFPEIKYLEQ